MAGGGDHGARELDQTPTWAVALVCAVIVLISILLEKVLHAVGETFERRRKGALVEALEKIKGELMVLGFISLLLTFGQKYIADICISERVADTMLPCPVQHVQLTVVPGQGGGHHAPGQGHHQDADDADAGEHRRRLLWNHIRILAADSPGGGCKPIREWKEWEKEVEHDYEAANDASRFRLTKETSFVRDNTSFGTTPVIFYTFNAMVFCSCLSSVECPWMASYVLAVHTASTFGTKLQSIIAQMALEIQERHAVVQGIPLVQVSDRHFWFGKPKLILHLVHLTLFQNAFEITYFLWITYEFGLHSCFHDSFYLAVLRVAIGVGVQILCSYITLPLYALVTQMGSTMKRSIFDDQTSKALMNWHKNAKKKKPTKPGPVETRKLGSPGDSPETSPSTKAGLRSRIEISNAEPSSSSQTANIVASVDIPEEIPYHDGRPWPANPDLLTGP
ncbi:hypothetical protein RND71_016327 [Anisodus tanguticus]|uniref:MLO-like protein n=1 Tax=Anisodus tanguticus TaxID=243964 RepID=A0AAE1S8A3_9SOLA|nr:hypothetical protein RND71_016327 [Anisodus tanguticus]